MMIPYVRIGCRYADNRRGHVGAGIDHLRGPAKLRGHFFDLRYLIFDGQGVIPHQVLRSAQSLLHSAHVHAAGHNEEQIAAEILHPRRHRGADADDDTQHGEPGPQGITADGPQCDANDRPDHRETSARRSRTGSSPTMNPSLKCTSRCANRATSYSWVTRMIVSPRSFSPCSRAMISSPVRLSRLPVGSSARITCGLVTSARAMATRCCSPPDICEG